uniref:Uncharacterized protein n=1 Tax=Arundo donax TaxID=35708 RepID=A0A0A8ZPG6_ARUDO
MRSMLQHPFLCLRSLRPMPWTRNGFPIYFLN